MTYYYSSWYGLCTVLCNDKCAKPAGINVHDVAATPAQNGCEIAIVLPNNVEAYAYRATHSQACSGKTAGTTSPISPRNA
jgi:hypothetical protein